MHRNLKAKWPRENRRGERIMSRGGSWRSWEHFRMLGFWDEIDAALNLNLFLRHTEGNVSFKYIAWKKGNPRVSPWMEYLQGANMGHCFFYPTSVPRMGKCRRQIVPLSRPFFFFAWQILRLFTFNISGRANVPTGHAQESHQSKACYSRSIDCVNKYAHSQIRGLHILIQTFVKQRCLQRTEKYGHLSHCLNPRCFFLFSFSYFFLST